MTVYGENEGQGKYWNEKPGQSWVAYDASMNERLSSISDILFEDLGIQPVVKLDSTLVVARVRQQDVCMKHLEHTQK